MPKSLAQYEKGHQFPIAAFEVSPQWVEEYRAAVGDEAILADAVPPMGVLALSIRALLEASELPNGAIHLAQEVAFQRVVHIGERLISSARISSRGERQGWALLGIEMTAEGSDGGQVMSGRATLTFPVGGEPAR